MSSESTRLHIQNQLDTQKTSLERNILGQFATPPSLAHEITALALPYLPSDAKIRFLEPAIGTGSFYESLINVASSRIESAVGVEIDPLFASAAEALWETTGLTVVNTDFTSLEPYGLALNCNLLITNPPYVRHHHIPSEHKRKLVTLSERATGIKLSGLAGLYVHFIMVAHKWLEADAISAWLIPSEFMDVNYGEGLKKYLTERVELLRVHRFCAEDIQFDDALVTSSVLVFRNRSPQKSNIVKFSLGGSIASPRETQEISVSELSETRKWSTIPRDVDQFYIKPEMILGDAFTIKRGLATGDNDFFIRPLSEFDALGIPRQFLRPILPAPRHVLEPLIEGDEAGYPLLERKLALFDCSLSESELQAKHPTVHELILDGKQRSIDTGYLCSGRKPWYSQERRDIPPLVCTYMGRPKDGQPPFRIIRNRSRAVATNVYLLIYPKPWIVKADFDGGLIDRVCLELRQLSSTDFTAEGRVYGGGLHKMEPRELARIPLRMNELLDVDRCVLQGVLFDRRKGMLA